MSTGTCLTMSCRCKIRALSSGKHSGNETLIQCSWGAHWHHSPDRQSGRKKVWNSRRKLACSGQLSLHQQGPTEWCGTSCYSLAKFPALRDRGRLTSESKASMVYRVSVCVCALARAYARVYVKTTFRSQIWAKSFTISILTFYSKIKYIVQWANFLFLED